MAAGPARQGPGSVVVGVDGSASAQEAVRWAAEEADLRGSGLFLVHATDTDAPARPVVRAETDGSRRTGREILDRTAAAVTARLPDLPVVRELSGGPPFEALRHAAAPSGTIVVGHRGLGGFAPLLLGSVALKVVAAATGPVVVVRGDTGASPHGAVLAAVRDGDDLGCARTAAHQALRRETSLRLLHVWRTVRPPVGRGTARDGLWERADDHARVLSGMAGRLHDEFPGLEIEADGGKSHSVPGALVEATRHACLLIVGGQQAPGHLGPTLGGTTLALTQHAHCPVELVPRHGPGDGSTP
ncbi:universal stress protein [Streptomyces sp. NPDC088557]|uniref:universal stress protein n=1 Tax=Streptomyces sp. NPDC088557 TaxID=3365867 RepID=UPI00380FB0F3